MNQTVTKVRCNHCDADDYTVLFKAGVAQLSQVVECNNCRLMYANPRGKPADQDVVKTYDPAITGNPIEYGRDRFDKERGQIRDYKDTIGWLAAEYPDRGSLIEIGCGMGFLLKAFADDGWDVTGVEPDRGYCNFISQTHGLRALPTILEESGLPEESADVVVMLHVIEHVPDPLGSLKAIWRTLKPGGHLVIETPRYDSLMFKILRHRERSLSCDGHINFFTTETLRNLYEKAGFVERHTAYVGRSLSLRRLLWNVGVMSKSDSVARILDRLSSHLKLDGVNFRLNMRDMQRVIARKPLQGARRG